jgi:hypothetical protein
MRLHEKNVAKFGNIWPTNIISFVLDALYKNCFLLEMSKIKKEKPKEKQSTVNVLRFEENISDLLVPGMKMRR